MLIISFQGFSQSFYHAGGVGLSSIIYHQTYKTAFVDADESGSTGIPGFVYNPFLSFDVNRKTAFNIAAYPMLGFNLNSRSGGSLGFELPVVGELFFGDVTDAGGFAGLGFAFGAAADEYWSGSILGPQLSGGAQFEVQQNLVKLRAAFTIGLNKEGNTPDITYSKDSRNMLSLQLLYLFGQ
ncbi:MAG: hypothetical protein R3A43_11135 [Bacteroidia bacterium]